MCSCDFDAPEFYDETTPRARKERRCLECRAVIAVGERYVRIAGKWDGGIDTSWMCLACREIARAINDAGCCWSLQDVLSCARETLSEHGPFLKTLTSTQAAAVARLGGLVMRHEEQRRGGSGG